MLSPLSVKIAQNAITLFCNEGPGPTPRDTALHADNFVVVYWPPLEEHWL